MNSESDTDDLDPENDGLPDPSINRPKEEIKVYDEDADGNLVENKRKTYYLTPVVERIGCFVNLDDKYYTAAALLHFEESRQKLLRFNRDLKKKKKMGDIVDGE